MILRNLTLIMISFSLTLNQARGTELKNLSNLNSQKPIEVSQEEMKKLIKDNPNNEVIKRKIKDGDEEEIKEEVKKVVKEEAINSPIALKPHSNISFSTAGNLNSDTALLVFAVVGLIVVIMWVPYFPILAYKAISGRENMKMVNHLSFEITPIENNLNNQSLSGSLISLRHSLYIKDESSKDFTLLGLSTELGHYDFDEYDSYYANHKNMNGEYVLIGPSLLINGSLDLDSDKFQTFGKIDLMGGTSFDGNLGLISKAELSLMGKFYKNLTAGIGIGALYLNVKRERGLATNVNDLSLFYSGKTGYLF